MKKIISIIISISFLFMMFTFTTEAISNPSENTKVYTAKELKTLIEESQKSSFILPESLQIIEDEAFEGTAILKLTLPASVTTIGARAFANISTLHLVTIPNTTNHIDATAFKGSANVTIQAAPNSYAKNFAAANNLPIQRETAITAGNASNVIPSANLGADPEIIEITDNDPGMTTPPWRPVYEITADRYSYFWAFTIQGRAPPICC